MHISTALEILRAEQAKLANIGQFPDSLSRYGDLETHRALKARILRRIRKAQRDANQARKKLIENP